MAQPSSAAPILADGLRLVIEIPPCNDFGFGFSALRSLLLSPLYIISGALPIAYCVQFRIYFVRTDFAYVFLHDKKREFISQ
jgi:hypothetical protein